MLALKKIQRASVLAPNEISVMLVKQIINAGAGRKDIARRDLKLMAAKNHSSSYARWFYEGFWISEFSKKSL